ncbi:androgen-dependent TFPI-regulating protein [Papilio machaon]|uniref:androgen-dependent TFPI-regulating protein n=1 Tax=Papilio machaon TaxID=76193 RepID=UPI001E66529D|nr:androgen-dependent TFPI-regulating protein [Papilio machaon]XP_045538511.1 androgen-dependent TFPI-regulating protein [Papilio machaon]
MQDNIYYRIIGYAATIIMHLSNIYFMAKGIKKEHLDDPVLRSFGNLQARYFTCWTFGLQIIYAVIGLICDFSTLRNRKNINYKLPKHLLGLRDTLFAAIIWPSTFLVFTVFWSLFLYDRNLILPVNIDKVLTPISNHVIHTAIVPVVLWELLFRPRAEPKSHIRYVAHSVFHLFVYLLVLTYTYLERGTWIYPVLTKAFGTINFPIICAVMLFIKIFSYFMQWKLNSIVHGKYVNKKPI